MAPQGSGLSTQPNGETAYRLPDDRQTVEHGCRQDFRNAGSRRIDDSGIFENLRAYPRLQPAFGNQVNAAPNERGQLLNKGFELDQAD
jgi:hypothetical protein